MLLNNNLLNHSQEIAIPDASWFIRSIMLFRVVSRSEIRRE